MTSRTLLLVALLASPMPAPAQTRVVALKAADDVGAAVLSPRGDRIGARVGKDRIAVWSLPEGKLLQEVTLAGRPLSLLFADADHLIVALADGGIEVRAVATGARVRRMDAGAPQSVLAVSADGRLLASSGTEQIRLWNSSGTPLHTFGHEFGDVATLAFSPDAKLLVSAGSDTNVLFWDVTTGQQKAALGDQLLSTFAMTFTADGRSLVIGGANGTIEVVDVLKSSIVRRFRPEKHAVMNLSLSPDGRSIGAAYFDVDGMARPAPVALWKVASGRVVRRVTPPGGPPTGSGFSSDGRLLYVTATGPELHVWALAGSTASSSDPTPR
jgi:WD40 repeat protein